MRAVLFSLVFVCLSAYVSGQTYTCNALNPLGTCPSGQTCQVLVGCVANGGYTCSLSNPEGTCPTGQTCLGSLGCGAIGITSPCSLTNPIGTCAAGKTCQLGVCQSSAITTGTGTCSLQTPLGTCPVATQSCVSGICIGLTGTGSGSINFGTCSPSCSAGQSCILGLCLRTTIPTCSKVCANNEYCYASGSSTTGSCQSLDYCGSSGCAVGTTCFGGSCIPTPFGFNSECSPPCVGSATCAFGQCIPQLPTGNCASCNATAGQVCRSGTCVSSANSNVCQATCGAGQFCNYGTCAACGVLCSTNTNAGATASLNTPLLNAFIGAGLSVAGLTANNWAQATATAFENFGNSIRPPPNQAVTFNGTVATGSTPLVFDNGASSATAFANIQTRLQFPAVYVNSPAAFALANGANFTAGNAQVNQRMDVAFDSGDAGSNGVRFDKLSASAPIYISGPGNVQFPARREDAVCKGSGCACNVAGGARLNGNAGNITLNIAATTTEVAWASVLAGNVLSAAGNILGSTGVLDLAGELIAAGAAIQPRVRVQNSGKLTIANTDVFTGGDVELSAGSTLKIGNGAKAYLKKLTCPTGATISASVAGTISTSAGGVFLNYAANTEVSALRCALVITDASGAAYVLSNPNAGTTGRRLLGTSCTTTFGETSAAYSCSSTGAATGITFSIAVIMASIIAALAAMF